MPNMDGLEFCRKVRAEGRDGYTFFIFLTALGGKEHLIEGMEAGADEYPHQTARLRQPESQARRRPPGRGAKEAPLRRGRRSRRRRNRGRGPAKPETETVVMPGVFRRPRISRLGRRAGRSRLKCGTCCSRKARSPRGSSSRLSRPRRPTRGSSARYWSPWALYPTRTSPQAQAHRLNLDFVELNEKSVDKGTLSLIPEKVLRRHGVLPLRVDDRQRLVVAMSDPANVLALEDLGMISGRSVIPVVATEAEIQRAQNKLFRPRRAGNRDTGRRRGRRLPGLRRSRARRRGQRGRGSGGPAGLLRLAAGGKRRRLRHPHRAPGEKAHGPPAGGRRAARADVYPAQAPERCHSPV